MKILLTGATSYLGSRILIELLNNNVDVVIIKRSLSEISNIKNVVMKCKCYDIDKIDLSIIFIENKLDGIIHCATDYGNDVYDLNNLISVNLILPFKLLEYSVQSKVKFFINTDTVLDKNINAYTLSKFHFKDWLKYFSKDLVCINVSLELFYGPYNKSSNFVTYLIANFIRNVDYIDLTDGLQKRDFIYIDDVVGAYLIILKRLNDFPCGFYNFEVATGKLTTVKEIVFLVQKLSGNIVTKLNFGALEYRKNDRMSYICDISKIQSLGWSAKYTLLDGLKKTFEIELINK